MRPAKTQISLGIRPVWSESSLSAWKKLGSLVTHLAHSEDAGQTGWMPRLIWIFAGRPCQFVGFVMMQFNYMICHSWNIYFHFTRWNKSHMAWQKFESPLFITKFVVKCATKMLKIGWQMKKLCPKICLNREFARKWSNYFPRTSLKS